VKLNRRRFLWAGLGGLSALEALSALQPKWTRKLEQQLSRLEQLPPDASAGDEDFWAWVKSSYTVSPTIINLNNGGRSNGPAN